VNRTTINEVATRPAHQTVTETRRLTSADIDAIKEAFTSAVRESLTPAPPPRRPNDSEDVHTGDNAGYRSRADILLGSFARGPLRSYSLSDLVATDDATDDDNARRQVALDKVFSGKPIG
jgi:hypothetical protein